MLQGKAKEEFEKWLKHKYKMNLDYPPFSQKEELTYTKTSTNALIIEWFDSVGIYCNAISFEKGKYWKSICDNVMLNKKYNSRAEATTKAIEKAVEIFNKLHNGK